MNDFYTFHEAVVAIDRATITGRVFPRALRDNGSVSRLLCLDWARTADRDGWLDYFGALPAEPGDYSRWARDWHGWSVLMTAHFADANDEDSGPVGADVRPLAVPVNVLSEGEALASALLDPDATIITPCAVTTRHEVHGSHTRHVGASSRYCIGWNELMVQMATVTR